MFHSTLEETEFHGGSGALHFFCSFALRVRFSLMTASLADSTEPSTPSASISRSSLRYSRSSADCPAQ